MIVTLLNAITVMSMIKSLFNYKTYTLKENLICCNYSNRAENIGNNCCKSPNENDNVRYCSIKNIFESFFSKNGTK